MFGDSSQSPTTAEHCFIVWTVLNDLINAHLAVVRSWEEPPSIWLTVAKNGFVGWALNFRVCMLLKGALRCVIIWRVLCQVWLWHTGIFNNIIVLFVFVKLPDLMHSESLQTDPVVTFACQNFGLLLGICIMLIIALYEEDLMAVNWWELGRDSNLLARTDQDFFFYQNITWL